MPCVGQKSGVYAADDASADDRDVQARVLADQPTVTGESLPDPAYALIRHAKGWRADADEDHGALPAMLIGGAEYAVARW